MPRPRKPKATPTWSEVKAKLAEFDRAKLLGLVADLYAASPENQGFLHARFGVGPDPLTVYKATIERWVSPDVYGGERESVANAKKAITDYRRAIGRPEGLAELTTYYCEEASGFAADFGLDGEAFYSALVTTFAQAIKAVGELETAARTPFVARLKVVRDRCERFGYGAGDNIVDLWARTGW